MTTIETILAGQTASLGEIIWNEDGAFDFLWSNPEIQPILEEIYLDEERCVECYCLKATNILGQVYMGEYPPCDIKVCDGCLPTTRGFQKLKDALFKNHPW